MTDREKAIVMAYTGKCTLTGDKFQIFHKYVEDIIGRPVFTHELPELENEIKEKSKADFIALCKGESCSEKPNKWISVNEESPKENQKVLMKTKDFGTVSGVYRTVEYGSEKKERFLIHYAIDSPAMAAVEVIEWMPLPE